ncbi:MAG: hypothetical protein KUG77_13120 [Nannocystaceae bacterium]|nr:hypothetical protein [Nannocystaceae bacterium]
MNERPVPAVPRSVALALALFTGWPMLHIVLTAGTGSDPWKLGGFGMYAAPRPRVHVELSVDTGRGVLTYDPATLDGPLQRKFRETRTDLAILGSWATPESLAVAILERYPKAQAVEVVVDTTTLDPESATLVTRTARYRYGR